MELLVKGKDLSRLIAEAIDNISPFITWKRKFDSYLYDMLQRLSRQYLDGLGLSVEIDYGYNFNGRHWLAAYEETCGRISDGVIVIAINYPHIYEEMVRRGIDNDDFNIEAQARITVGHEIGHGLIDFLLNYCEAESGSLDEFIRAYYDGDIDEEEAAEEFGETMFPPATGRRFSYIGNLVSDILKGE